MKTLNFNLLAAAIVVAVLGLAPSRADALLPRMGPPITTTVIVTKPAPGQIYGNKQVVTFGVGTKKYKFVLDDGYVDDASGRIVFPDVWQYVSQHQPNFVVQGIGSDTFEKIEPGQTLTIRGMFAPLDRTFEVMGTELGRPAYETPEKSY
jgi:hypothetical protein